MNVENSNNGDSILELLESNLPDIETQKEPRTYHRRGQRFKSSTAHHSVLSSQCRAGEVFLVEVLKVVPSLL